MLTECREYRVSCVFSPCWTVKLCCLDDVEARSGRSYDVAVRLLLDELHRLLLLQDQETVELSGRLLLVVVPAQIQQAHRLGACFGHHPLWQRERESGREGSGILHVFIQKYSQVIQGALFGTSIDGGM